MLKNAGIGAAAGAAIGAAAGAAQQVISSRGEGDDSGSEAEGEEADAEQ